jgi:putative SOS response-associated peptidase YedK
MCGRVTITYTWIMLQRHLAPFVTGLDAQSFSLPEIEPRYNVPPMAQLPVVRASADAVEATTMQWWLVPHWSKTRTVKYTTFNARGEDIDTKAAFRKAFKAQRCLIPATGFYEWEKLEGTKTKRPHLIRRADSDLFCFAGVWDSWTDTDTGEVLDSCSIITAPANKLLSKIHHRCPVVLPPEQYATWLDPTNQNAAALKQMLVPPADNAPFVMHGVSTYVSNARNEGPRCTEPNS